MSIPVLHMSEHKCVYTHMNMNSKVHLKMCRVQNAYVLSSLPPFSLTPSLSPSFALFLILLTLVHLKQKAVGVFKVTLVYNF